LQNRVEIVRAAKQFSVRVIISNKEGAADPEGETIFRDLVLRSGYKQVKSIRTGKFLSFEVAAEDAADARTIVARMCDDLRIYNPAAHSIRVEA